tara:strand:- start:127 stop:369 length:243 start_codon:yes stop_codon:yes gene_type:complete
MIAWIVYIIVFSILFFVLYLGILGVMRGLEAKNNNKLIKIKYDTKSSKYTSNELKKLKNLYDNGVIDKKEFSAAKKKLLS